MGNKSKETLSAGLNMTAKKVLTLCFVYQHPRVLLGMKKRGFGAGRWNGFGGKVASYESVENAARREIHEEAGVEVGNLEKRGIIDFSFEANPEILEVHVFCADEIFGNPVETEEMKPQWFNISTLPTEKMWSDDRLWLPLFFAGKKFQGWFKFDRHDQVLEHRLEEVKELTY